MDLFICLISVMYHRILYMLSSYIYLGVLLVIVLPATHLNMYVFAISSDYQLDAIGASNNQMKDIKLPNQSNQIIEQKNSNTEIVIDQQQLDIARKKVDQDILVAKSMQKPDRCNSSYQNSINSQNATQLAQLQINNHSAGIQTQIEVQLNNNQDKELCQLPLQDQIAMISANQAILHRQHNLSAINNNAKQINIKQNNIEQNNIEWAKKQQKPYTINLDATIKHHTTNTQLDTELNHLKDDRIHEDFKQKNYDANHQEYTGKYSDHTNYDLDINQYLFNYNQLSNCRARSASILKNVLWEHARVIIFVSFSIPSSRLKSLLKDAAKINGLIVFRGMLNNSMKLTQKKLIKLKKEYQVEVIIHPQLYQEFAILHVPSFVLAIDKNIANTANIKTDKAINNMDIKIDNNIAEDTGYNIHHNNTDNMWYTKLSGDMSLYFAIDAIRKHTKNSQLSKLAIQYLSKLDQIN